MRLQLLRRRGALNGAAIAAGTNTFSFTGGRITAGGGTTINQLGRFCRAAPTRAHNTVQRPRLGLMSDPYQFSLGRGQVNAG